MSCGGYSRLRCSPGGLVGGNLWCRPVRVCGCHRFLEANHLLAGRSMWDISLAERIQLPSDIVLRAPIVGMDAEAGGGGYWLAAADGGVFSFGDAPYLGSAARTVPTAPIVGMATDPNMQGYWLVASDGGVFAFGDAQFHGSAAGFVLRAPRSSMAATPDGCWLLARCCRWWRLRLRRCTVPRVSSGTATPRSNRRDRPHEIWCGLSGRWLRRGIFAFGAAPFVGAHPGAPGLDRRATIPDP